MVYVITGATGDVGSLVVEGLITRGERPRVFVRDARKARARFGDRVDICVGDLANAASLAPALKGADALFLLNSGPHLAERDAAAAQTAKEAGVQHVVKLSSHDARQNVGTGVWHARGEAAIRACGIPFTLVQPSGFMSNALFWKGSLRTEGIVRTCTGDGQIPFIHSRDIADVAIAALTSRKYDGESLTITGPEALSYPEMIAKIGAAIGKQLECQFISEDKERLSMLDFGEPLEIVNAHLSIYRAIRGGLLAFVTGTVERVLGRKPISFDQWIQEHIAAFR